MATFGAAPTGSGTTSKTDPYPFPKASTKPIVFPTAPKPQPVYQAPVSNNNSGGGSYSGGGGSTDYSGGTSGNYSGGTVTPQVAQTAVAQPIAQQPVVQKVSAPIVAKPVPVVKPKPNPTEKVVIPDPQADATYKGQRAALQKALANYRSGQTLQNNQYNANYQDGLHKLGWDGRRFRTDNGEAYAQTVGDNTSDFASRGLGRSSAFADSLGTINKQFGDQKSGLDRSRGDYMDTQNSALRTYQDQTSATDHNDLLDAISRIATQKGVDLSQVVPGKQSTITRPL